METEWKGSDENGITKKSWDLYAMGVADRKEWNGQSGK